MFYEKVVIFCKENGISISKFEKMCDLGNGVIGRWKGGKSKPSMNTVEKISKYTNKSILYWLG